MMLQVIVLIAVLSGIVSYMLTQSNYQMIAAMNSRLVSGRDSVEKQLQTFGSLGAAIRQSLLYEQGSVLGLSFLTLGMAPTSSLPPCIANNPPVASDCVNAAFENFTLLATTGDASNNAILMALPWGATPNPATPPLTSQVGAMFKIDGSPCTAGLSPESCPIETFVLYQGLCGVSPSPCAQYESIVVSYFIRHRLVTGVPVNVKGLVNNETQVMGARQMTLPPLKTCKIVNPSLVGC